MKRMILFLSVLLFALCTAAFGEEPKAKLLLGYPWSTWGEISETMVGHTEKGFKLDGYAEQGVDWFKFGNTDLTFNTFVGIRGTVSDRAGDFWNNKVGPWVGFKFRQTLNIGEGHWGEIDFGARWEYYRYLRTEPVLGSNIDNRVVLFLQWNLGGDWKKNE
jgi:hypothetical protein